MLHLDTGIEQNAAALGFQARPQLDVFNCRPVATIIEAAARQESFLTYSAAARPECGSFRLAGPMRKAMQKVAILRNEGPGRWRIVVGADDRVERRIASKMIQNAAKGVSVDADIRIQK
jgi:hypothetical protein